MELGSDNAVNAVLGVTAKQKSSDRTKKMTVSILEPGAAKAIELSYAEALTYAFDKEGDYKITYNVKNYYYPYKKSTKTVIIKCIKPVADEDNEIEVQPVTPTDPVDPTDENIL